MAFRAQPAAACAGLIGSNGAVNLGRTSTLAAYADGVEHYVTAFEFQGGGGQFGTLIPLPDVPTKVERGGAWTLQRLVRETEPQPRFAPTALRAAAADGAAKAEVLLETRVDALDLTVLKGGGPAVAEWATAHGFRLSPDAPEVLEFYARRSPIFLAAVFDGAAAVARGQRLGDGTPIHLTIPTSNPWVPLRILALGKRPDTRVEADAYLLTPAVPSLLPAPRPELRLLHSAPATARLLDDLRSDAGMSWVPRNAWLTKLRIDAPAGEIRYDLAVDASGQGAPSPIAAGLVTPPSTRPTLQGALGAARDGLKEAAREISALDAGPSMVSLGAVLSLAAVPLATSYLARRRARAQAHATTQTATPSHTHVQGQAHSAGQQA